MARLFTAGFVSQGYIGRMVEKYPWQGAEGIQGEGVFDVSEETFLRAVSRLATQEDRIISFPDMQGYHKTYLIGRGLITAVNPGCGWYVQIYLQNETMDGLEQQAEFLGFPSRNLDSPSLTRIAVERKRMPAR